MAQRAQSIANAVHAAACSKHRQEIRVYTYQVPRRQAAIGIMDLFPETKPHGAFSALLADKDLAHLELVLHRSLSCDLGGPLLPTSYWRERIAALTRQAHLTPTQLQTVHRLHLIIDLYEIDAARKPAAPEPPLSDDV
jgi:hypothetical protein